MQQATSQLTGDQARALWEAGGFFLLTGLPQGSEYGVDGTFHIVRRFSGTKFIPPGLHLFTWSPSLNPTSTLSSMGSTHMTIRSGLVRYLSPKQRLEIKYDPTLEDVPFPTHFGGDTVDIPDSRLVGIDSQLASYPFDGLERWKSLTSLVSSEVVDHVLGSSGGRVDGLTPVIGEVEVDEMGKKGWREKRKRVEVEKKVDESDEQSNQEAGKFGQAKIGMKFPVFDLKRSFRSEAVGEEVTRFAQDKSWLLGQVASENGGFIPLLGHLQLSFVLLLYLSSYSSLLVYKRILILFCRSSSIFFSPSSPLHTKIMRQTYIALVNTLASQLSALPSSSFDTELPEMERVYLEEIENLRKNLNGSMGRSDNLWVETEDGEEVVSELKKAWKKLQAAGKEWGWEVDDLRPTKQEEEEEEEEEEGEYAPVIVEM